MTLGSDGDDIVFIGGEEKITFPNYLLHVVMALSYMRHIEKYDDIE